MHTPAARRLSLPAEVRAELEAGALFVINHSGGKDSQAMTVALAELLPADQVLVVHAELPGADWAGIPEHLEATVPAAWPVTYTRAGKTFREMVERRAESRPDAPCWPSPATRQCTSDLKRDPIARTVRQHVKANPQHGGRVVHVIGIRAEESSARARAATWSLNKRESKAGRTVHTWHPILDWTLEEVRATVAAAGQELHPAYAAGMSRLSCRFCVMASTADLACAARLDPEGYAEMVALEETTGYTMAMDGRGLEERTGVSVDVAFQERRELGPEPAAEPAPAPAPMDALEALELEAPCPHCGALEVAELLEVWGDREWLPGYCCEAAQWDILDATAQDPEVWTLVAKRAGVEELAPASSRGLRRVAEVDGQAVLDWNLELGAVDWRTARDFVAEHHRHCAPPRGWRFGQGIWNGRTLVGVVIVGRPVARAYPVAEVVEVTRLTIAQDVPAPFAWNACSMLYGWAAREAKRRGFRRVITYTLESEAGTTLRAAGFQVDGRTKRDTWSTPSRPRATVAPPGRKTRWARELRALA